jgi:hypothetical protein
VTSHAAPQNWMVIGLDMVLCNITGGYPILWI